MAPASVDVSGSTVARIAGAALGLGGLGLIAVGLHARRDVRRTLARERITPVEPAPDGAFVSSAAEARSLVELIRRSTLETTGGRTYSEVAAYVDADGKPTGAREHAAPEPLTRAPVENPDHALWVQSTTLQTALMQAYMGFRLAELTVALGAAFAAAGAGIGLAGRRQS